MAVCSRLLIANFIRRVNKLEKISTFQYSHGQNIEDLTLSFENKTID